MSTVVTHKFTVEDLLRVHMHWILLIKELLLHSKKYITYPYSSSEFNTMNKVLSEYYLALKEYYHNTDNKHLTIANNIKIIISKYIQQLSIHLEPEQKSTLFVFFISQVIHLLMLDVNASSTIAFKRSAYSYFYDKSHISVTFIKKFADYIESEYARDLGVPWYHKRLNPIRKKIDECFIEVDDYMINNKLYLFPKHTNWFKTTRFEDIVKALKRKLNKLDITIQPNREYYLTGSIN